MSKPYRTCPHCGAHLDCGEICDCQTADSENERQERREAAGRAERNRTEPALMAAV